MLYMLSILYAVNLGEIGINGVGWMGGVLIGKKNNCGWED